MSDELAEGVVIEGGAKLDHKPENLDPMLLSLLVCPATRGPLRYDRDAHELISERAALAYPIRDGVPIMLPDEARDLDP